jgi:putative transposase
LAWFGHHYCLPLAIFDFIIFAEEQIIGILKSHSQGAKISDLSREINMSETTIYKWIAKFEDMEISDAKKIKALGDENSRLKHMVADLSLDN